jgi:hypothetical protein
MGWVVNATPPPLYFWGKRLFTRYKGGWVGSRAGPSCFGKIRPKRDSISGPSSRKESLNQVRYPYLRISYMLIKSIINLKAVFNFSRVWKRINLNFIALVKNYKILNSSFCTFSTSAYSFLSLGPITFHRILRNVNEPYQATRYHILKVSDPSNFTFHSVGETGSQHAVCTGWTFWVMDQ